MGGVLQLDMRTTQTTEMIHSSAKKVRSLLSPPRTTHSQLYSVRQLSHDLRDQADHQRQRDHEGG